MEGGRHTDEGDITSSELAAVEEDANMLFRVCEKEHSDTLHIHTYIGVPVLICENRIHKVYIRGT